MMRSVSSFALLPPRFPLIGEINFLDFFYKIIIVNYPFFVGKDYCKLSNGTFKYIFLGS